MVTFALGGLALWMPIYLHEVKGLTLAQANQILSLSVAGAGGLGILTGGFLGSRLLTYTLAAPLWLSGLGIVLALPLTAVVIFVAVPALYIPALAGAIFLLFLNPGVLTAVVVSVAALGAFGGHLGGAPLGRAALRVTIGGALAMVVTALIGRILGVSVS